MDVSLIPGGNVPAATVCTTGAWPNLNFGTQEVASLDSLRQPAAAHRPHDRRLLGLRRAGSPPQSRRGLCSRPADCPQATQALKPDSALMHAAGAARARCTACTAHHWQLARPANPRGLQVRVAEAPLSEGGVGPPAREFGGPWDPPAGPPWPSSGVGGPGPGSESTESAARCAPVGGTFKLLGC